MSDRGRRSLLSEGGSETARESETAGESEETGSGSQWTQSSTNSSRTGTSEGADGQKLQRKKRRCMTFVVMGANLRVFVFIFLIIMGLLAGFGYFLPTVGTWIYGGDISDTLRTTLALVRTVALGYMLTVSLYNVGTYSSIIAYDNNEHEHLRATVAEEREALTGDYEDAVESMDGLLKRALHSNLNLVEQQFESDIKDFLRFLGSMKTKTSIIEGSHEIFIRELKEFIKFWVQTFKDTSVDPVNHPRVLLLNDDIDRCRDVNALTSLLHTRFTHMTTQTQIMTAHKDEIAELSKEASEARVADKEEEIKSAAWIQCSKSFRFRFGKGEYPRTAEFGFLKVTTLSEGHKALTSIFMTNVVSVTLVILHLIYMFGRKGESDDANVKMVRFFEQGVFAEELFALICITILIINIKKVDSMAAMKAELVNMKKKFQAATNHIEEMKHFWDQVAPMGAVWQHHSVPRLAFMKQCGVYVEHAESRELEAVLGVINTRLNDLNKELGPVADLKSNFGLLKRHGIFLRSVTVEPKTMREFIAKIDQGIQSGMLKAKEQDAIDFQEASARGRGGQGSSRGSSGSSRGSSRGSAVSDRRAAVQTRRQKLSANSAMSILM